MAISNPTMTEGYKYAVLATASYVRMGGLVLNGATFAQQAARPDLSGGRIPIAQGSYFFDPANTYGVPVWNILSYYGSDSPASQDAIAAQDKSGFGATLFEKGGEKVLAMRGTEPFEDGAVDLLSADLGQIGILGLALTQVVSMANYVMRLRTPVGANVPQITVSARAQLPLESERYVRAKGDASAGVGDVYFVFSDTTSTLGLGKVAAGDVVKLTGHSLGGHLAYMAARLFPDVFDRNVTVVNSAGYDPTKANEVRGLFEIISGLLLNVGPLGVAQIFKTKIADEVGVAAIFLDTYANSLTEVSLNKIRAGLFGEAPFVQGVPIVTSIRSEDLAPGDDKNIVASETTGAEKYGASIDVPTEANNHIVEPLMDALAFQALIEPLQGGSINSGSLVRLLEASSNQSTRSYEGFTEALYRLFLKDEKFLNELGARDASRLPTSDESSLVGTGKGLIGARNAFYDAVLRIQQEIAAAPSPLTLASLADMPLAELKSRAQATNGIAYRYALRELNPFAILGPDALYATHNAAGTLNYNDASSPGLVGMSTSYIADRAKFLAWRIQVNTVDAANVAYANDAHAWSFEDRAQNYSILIKRLGVTTSPTPSQIGQVIFGADVGTQSLLGGAEIDHLYGGSGNDSIDGKSGKDYLEGNAGNDTLIGGPGDDELQGGSGFDTYVYVDGDGFDTITDSDGAGRIQYNGRYLTGGSKVDDGLYVDASGVEYKFLEYAEGIGALLIDGEIYIEDYFKGDLGLTFDEDALIPLPPTTVTAHVYEDNELPVGFNSGEVSNLLNALYGSVHDDRFSGSSQVAALLGRSGNDVAILDANSYWIDVDMGAWNDFIDASSSAGSDLTGRLAGGAGNDYILGGDGNDIIWGDNYRATHQVSRSADVVSIDGFIYNAAPLSELSRYAGLPPGYGVFFAPYSYLSEIAGIFNANLSDLASDGTIFSGALDGAIAFVVGVDSSFDDFIDAGSGDDFVAGGSGSDHIIGGSGNDRILGDYGGGPQDAPTYKKLSDFFGPFAGLFGRPGDDFIDGGVGNDSIVDADGGNDVLSGGEGSDTIYSAEVFWAPADGEGAHNVISGGSGNDVIEVQNLTGGFDVVDAGEGDDQILVYVRHFELDTDDDDEIDVFGPTTGRAFVFGGSGNDVLNVSADEAMVDGGTGDDDYIVTGRYITISDSSGEDTLRLSGIFDHSTFDASVEALLTEDEDEFSNQKLSVFVTQDGGDLIATLSSTVDELLVDYSQTRFSGWFVAVENRIEHIVVSDGFGGEAVLTSDQLSSWGGFHVGGGGADELLDSTDYADISFGHGGDDLIATGAGNDRIYGGTGDDELYGGSGDDIYYYAAGDGDDLIYDMSGFNEIRVGPGLSTDDIGATVSDMGIVLRVGAGKITVVGGLRSDPGIYRFHFSDGTTMSVTSLLPEEVVFPESEAMETAPVVLPEIDGGDAPVNAGNEPTSVIEEDGFSPENVPTTAAQGSVVFEEALAPIIAKSGGAEATSGSGSASGSEAATGIDAEVPAPAPVLMAESENVSVLDVGPIVSGESAGNTDSVSGSSEGASAVGAQIGDSSDVTSTGMESAVVMEAVPILDTPGAGGVDASVDEGREAESAVSAQGFFPDSAFAASISTSLVMEETPIVRIVDDNRSDASVGRSSEATIRIDEDMPSSDYGVAAIPRPSTVTDDVAFDLSVLQFRETTNQLVDSAYLQNGKMLETRVPTVAAEASAGNAPLSMQVVLDAIAVFDAVEGSPPARNAEVTSQSMREKGEGNEGIGYASTLTSVVLTNALLLFHLEQSDLRGMSDGAGELFRPGDALPTGFGVFSGLSSFGSGTVAREGRGLPIFAGLQEGLARLL